MDVDNEIHLMYINYCIICHHTKILLMIYFLAATQMSLSEVVGIKLMGLELKLKGGKKNSLVKSSAF